MIKIQVSSIETVQRTSKAGKPYYKQEAWAYLVNRDGVQEPHPSKIQLMVEKNQHGVPQPYQPGDYMLNPSSLRVGRFGDLEIGFVNLSPMRPPVAKVG